MTHGTGEALSALLAGARAADLEHDQLDFKQPAAEGKTTLKILADAAVCFANAIGGDVVLGVNDKAAGRAAVVGVPPAMTVDGIRRGIFERRERIGTRCRCRSTASTTQPATTSVYSNTQHRTWPGDVVATPDGLEALVTSRVEAESGALTARLEVAITPMPPTSDTRIV